MKKYKINAEEICIECNGISFLCQFGIHINGGWCAITTFGVSTEMSHFEDDISYNANKLYTILDSALIDRDILPTGKFLKAIALYISETITPLLAQMNN